MPRIVPASVSPSHALPDASSTQCIVDVPSTTTVASDTLPELPTKPPPSPFKKPSKSRFFPSLRLFMALLLMLCFVALAVSTSNLSVSMVCMVKKDATETPEHIVDDIIRLRRNTNNSAVGEYLDIELGVIANSTVTNETEKLTKCELARLRKRAIEYDKHPEMIPNMKDTIDSMKVENKTCMYSGTINWTGAEQGLVFASQNVGSLFMIFTGAYADRLNSKWCVVLALIFLIISNAALPFVARISFWLAVGARIMTGLADSLLSPSTNSMITRWFPPKERPFAIGLITGGRQVGTLLILPTAGYLCDNPTLGGWPAIFYLSSFIVSTILLLWIVLSADKPAKHCCISSKEETYVQAKIQAEHVGKRSERKSVPWKEIFRCVPLYAGVAALICHEYPLVIMLQLLPMYMKDVLKLNTWQNGLYSALPPVVLFFSKTLSSSLASAIGSRKRGRFVFSHTVLVRIFNGTASLGLGICIGLVPFVGNHVLSAIFLLCFANVFAGMHTPGVQTALLQLAPAYSGIVTGIAFFCVACTSIFNKIVSNMILSNGTLAEWTLVFEISAVVAVLPVFFFTIWGSADRQPWATTKSADISDSNNKTPACVEKDGPAPQFIVGGDESADDDYLANGLKFTLFLSEVASLHGGIDEDSVESDETDSTHIAEDFDDTDDEHNHHRQKY